MIGLRRALWALGVAGLAFGLALIPIEITSHHQDVRGLAATLVIVTGLGFIRAGLFAWFRRPDNIVGALMVATGFAWFLSSLEASNVPGLFITGVLFNTLVFGVLIHLLLAFPDGRLHRRAERVVVALAYVLTGLGNIAPVLTLRTSDFDCKGCPENPLVAFHSASTEQIWTAGLNLLAVVVAVSVLVLLRLRWKRATPPERRTLATVWLPGALVLVLLAISLGISAAGSDALGNASYFVALFGLAAMPYVFMLGMARERIAQGGAVAEFVSNLGGMGAPDELRDSLRRALRDETVELLYWLPESKRYVDGAGHAAGPPDPGSGRVLTPVDRDGQRVAALVHDAALSTEESAPLRTVSDAAALALENARLDAELRSRLEELRTSRARLLEVGFSERRRLERDLHDGAQQRLVSLALNLRMARSRLHEDPAAADALLESAGSELDSALEELRELARGIHPAVLTDRGLDAALESLISRAPLPVEHEQTLDERLPGPVELAAYFVVAEALNNVVKYARADHATIRTARSNGDVRIEIADDGVGGAGFGAGSGLRGLADRVAALDGRLEVESPPGSGTTITATIPCE